MKVIISIAAADAGCPPRFSPPTLFLMPTDFLMLAMIPMLAIFATSTADVFIVDAHDAIFDFRIVFFRFSMASRLHAAAAFQLSAIIIS
jgi:hypothetical protein